jgi:hypothetical protein
LGGSGYFDGFCYMVRNMAILVDCNPDHGRRYPYTMLSDEGVEELVRFGSRIGLKEEWLQNDDGVTLFRINYPKREEALAKGAIQASMREIVAAIVRLAMRQHPICHNLCNPSRPAEG